MRSLIVYYSYSGNTARVAETLKEILSRKGEVGIFELKPKDESGSFLGQANRAARRVRAQLPDAPFNAAGYDLVCIGTPVWAFAPAPAVNTYIDGIKNLEGKDAVCFITYGSGLGAERCLNLMKASVREKGAFKIFTFGIQQKRVGDKVFVNDTIEKAI